ncbi:MAG: bifunctional demethylmenaquinone methyltransferase/2-methoxy-6-polyprenyl-1,4-benzoquinol methylase UbiE [Sedimentisphaerales bacterium]|nr:bifunctional demethylmenaquinone methyltransferase/2-methoxy-6-polyprenyl-1,4-benzoquinol methylase UbiE [Sedimentisphaerales bacterium]
MFDRIALNYNLLNHILSLGLDFSWRRKLIKNLETERKIELLDLAAGTGDVVIQALRKTRNIEKALALDISENMLEICRSRLAKARLADRVDLLCADAARTGLPDDSFDAITIAFGIRNVPDVAETLDEMHRLLRHRGRALILEFSLPTNRFLRPLYLLYLRCFVPLIGALVARDRNAYRYLNTTIEKFHQPDDFRRLMRQTGFKDVRVMPMTCGIVALYSGTKP